ncbi:MAG: MBOAT family protein [Verrucomicrobiales bacterium]|nr:MBOAT family protein [Verrucomicrobiales bacterium]
MLFTQIEFYFFLFAVFGSILLIRNYALQKWVLLLASYYFYAYWDWRFAGLLLSCTAVNYFLAGRMAGASPKHKKGLITVSLVYSLGVLGFFKYFNFFVDSFRSLLGYAPDEASTLDIILPVGISFYTFQTLSYTIDVYRGQLKHDAGFRDFALFVAFFPQLVAGPIVRASEFLPQLKTRRKLSWDRAFDGFRQFTLGLFKKVFIADRLALFVDPAFENAEALSGLTLWIVILAYAIQIYCDFSGYSDMAIGIARAMGYDFSRNFNHPYIATDIQDFWRRWHISLSSWLRDYLYIPLGGNRKGRRRTYLNLLVTMVLGGLWHGAAWTFVVWGALHGGALAIDRWLRERFGGEPRARHAPRKRPLHGGLGWGITLVVVLVGWTFFRAADIGSAWNMLGRMFTFADGLAWYSPFALSVIGAVAGYHGLIALGIRPVEWLKANTVFGPSVLFLMLWLVIAFFPRGFQPFIYFQF